MKFYKLAELSAYAYAVALKNSVELIEKRVNCCLVDKSTYNVELIADVIGLVFDENGNIINKA